MKKITLYYYKKQWKLKMIKKYGWQQRKWNRKFEKWLEKAFEILRDSEKKLFLSPLKYYSILPIHTYKRMKLSSELTNPLQEDNPGFSNEHSQNDDETASSLALYRDFCWSTFDQRPTSRAASPNSGHAIFKRWNYVVYRKFCERIISSAEPKHLWTRGRWISELWQ